MVKAHWSVVSPDLELQRPEYLGGCRTPINISQVEQTAQATGTTPADKYNATLGATGAYSHTQSDALNNSGGFTKSFTEHGYIMCIGCVRTEQTYYQGYNRL